MPTLNVARTRELLQQFDFQRLFIEELGWDRHSANIEVAVDSQYITLTAVAEKRGMAVFICASPTNGNIPTYSMRRKIEREVAKTAHEHLIIYTDTAKTAQVWQWVKREAGRPAACREHAWNRGQSGAALVQKLQLIAFSLVEEERLSLVEVTGRTRAAFDVDRVTKRFYERFQQEHRGFLDFIEGITAQGDREWYSSVMLNRLMFTYFIQKKGFLDGDPDYLRNRLRTMQARKGKDAFYSFFRHFLLRLFHEGLGYPEHSAELDALIGRVPYLNGGLFAKHLIEEQYGDAINISDEAFERIFDFFDRYQWHLDERPLRNDNEINPDVLGYIFEKYINQKQMGAYYTKEDITGYIAGNTIIPFLFERARAECRVAFEGEQSVWRLLQADPDRYIYEAVRRGVISDDGSITPESALPDFVQTGMRDPKARMFDRRYNLGEADSRFALPTETWREYVERRKRCLDLRQKLAAGEVREISDLITCNLNIRQFAQDVIENCEGPELLRAFWHAIKKITVLDPTCGSGAFLFAALNVLEMLYEACLDRMQAFVDDLDRSGEKHRPEKFSDFRTVLEEVDRHPNHKYFIYKSIILGNLYGVDIMEEAVEIAKLRLFLKLAAQVERVEDVEPLPDIDFNIRAGNTLVGFASLDEVKKALSGDMIKLLALPDIEERADEADRAFQMFRAMQTAHGMDAKAFTEAKAMLRTRLRALEDELNRYLAEEYGVNADKKAAYEKWLANHQPFHWFVEFFGIMKNGGFDVTIGNPPYVETNKVSAYRPKGYRTGDSGNLYAMCLERSGALLSRGGYIGLIVPLSGFSTERMVTYQDFVWDRFNTLAISFYSGDAHPSVLFDGVKYRLCIIIGANRPGQGHEREVAVTDYLRWYADERPMLFPGKVAYTKSRFESGFLRFAKVGSCAAKDVVSKLLDQKITLGAYLKKAGNGHITYHRSPVFWIRSMDFEPYFKSPVKDRSTDHIKDLFFLNVDQAQKAGAVLNSSLFYLWFTVQGNCRNIAGPDIENLPVGDLRNTDIIGLSNTFAELMSDLRSHSRRRVYVYQASGKVEYDEFYPDKSKPIIDKIDCVLARHYGFTDEELDFIINYDIKYRMGRDSGEGEE